jgi:nucleoside-diphosphate-sugar epimerase
MANERVLVTGGSGYIAAFILVRLLNDGWKVRTTVRRLARAAEVKAMVAEAGADASALEFAEAELTSDAGWIEAVTGCAYVLHVASPFPEGVPRHADELVVPAREGTLRVLRAARAAGVRRVVLTSSFAAVGYGHPEKTSFTEADWTDADSPEVSPYARSKTLAERAAWDFVNREGGLELATVNPVVVVGPVLGSRLSTSVQLIRRLLQGAVPGLPRLSMGIVDVRDVADLHVRAMTAPAAAGQRFLAVAGPFLSLRSIATALKERLGADARRVPTFIVPDWVVKLVALFDRLAAQGVPELGRHREADSGKARAILGWSPRSAVEALADTGRSLKEHGFLRP